MNLMCLLLVVFIPAYVLPQSNLVVNGSFEHYHICPSKEDDFRFPVVSWNRLSESNSTDYYNAKYIGCYSPSLFELKRYSGNIEFMGSDGSGFIGMYPCCLNLKKVHGMCLPGYMEPIIGKLNPLLEAQGHYTASITVYLPYLSTCNVKSLSIVLLKDSLIGNPVHPEDFISLNEKLSVVEHQIIEFDISALIRKRNEWVRFSRDFKAHGDQGFLLVGFYPDFDPSEKLKLEKALKKNNTKRFYKILSKTWTTCGQPYDKSTGNLNDAYLYIDSIEITPVDDSQH